MSLLPSQRHIFDIPDNIAYFNCAYNSPQLNESKQRLLAGVQSKSHPWERTAKNFFDDAETIRSLSAQIFGGDVDGYAVVPAASYGISTAARAVEPHLHAGDRILVIAEEFPSVVLPWRRTAQETGAVLFTVPAPADGNWTQAILDHIDASAKVVAVSSCHWTNGAYIDLRRIGEACRATGSILVVDATQTLGAMPFSMDEVQPDFLVAAGYKWLLCPYGFSLLYVAGCWRDARPLEESWLARDNAEDFTALVKYSGTYMPGARRFDVGEKCTATILPGAVAALEQIKAWGVQNIAASLADINARIARQLAQLGCRLPDDAQRCPHMFGAQLPPSYSGNLVAELKARHIYISQRGNALRFAPHLHVNEQDVERLLASLGELIA
ncbi:MAG: aminotransferase class V-fold PLP-dependent enzyme [Gammaproteobacteria bacterium]|nr:aminotransferase class V-fold PLP-dependent enzyme [Gammaproteobacteria bacterium]MBU1969675.1 aminotransferase class V-fold PLP-dependent enzyme [Gammaproteobacteria bacterium]